jgi:hypothetical protein
MNLRSGRRPWRVLGCTQIALAVVTWAVLVACAGGATGDLGARQGGASCAPALPQVSKDHVRLGAVVVVHSTGLHCRPLFGQRQKYVVRMFPPRRGSGRTNYSKSLVLKSFEVGRRGTFRVSVRIPRSAPPGLAFLIVRGPELNKRVACPPNASCKRYGVGIRLVGAKQ